jgi:hypothetical protein
MTKRYHPRVAALDDVVVSAAYKPVFAAGLIWPGMPTTPSVPYT